jgi:hypothetical protein
MKIKKAQNRNIFSLLTLYHINCEITNKSESDLSFDTLYYGVSKNVWKESFMVKEKVAGLMINIKYIYTHGELRKHF